MEQLPINNEWFSLEVGKLEFSEQRILNLNLSLVETFLRGWCVCEREAGLFEKGWMIQFMAVCHDHRRPLK